MPEGQDGEAEFEVPPEQAPSAAAEPGVAPAGRAPAVSVSTSGLQVGDLMIGVVPALGTDASHDNAQNQERARARENDARAAEHACGGDLAPSTEAASELDVSVTEARTTGREAPLAVPIVLHDPLTGQPIATT